jgi:CxxC-x17-CxxC domain-containing protein
MRFGNGRDGLNSGPGKMTGVTCSDFGCSTGVPFPADGPRPAYSQECLPKAQAKGLLVAKAILKGLDYNTVTSF